MITVTRTTKESRICVSLDPAGLTEEYKKDLETPSAMLSHMLEHLSYRSGMGLKVSCEYDGFPLAHVLFEDLGITVGRAFGRLSERQVKDGCYGYGDAVGMIDEAYAQAAVSFESRALFLLEDAAVSIPAACEDAKSEDLETFLDGFCQGAHCTLQVEVRRGKNAHHIWEAVYRAVGSALEHALTCHPARAGKTSGVAGQIQWEISEENK